MPADHVSLDTPAIQTVVSQGAAHADEGAVVTFVITPDSPETGYGYIQTGPALGNGKDVYKRQALG